MFEVQVNVFNTQTGEREWRSVRLTEGNTYQFASREDAVKFRNNYYPDTFGDPNQIRIVEV